MCVYTIWREGEREGESGILHDVATATIHLLAIYLPQSSLEVGLVRTHWMVRCVAPNKLELIKNRKDAFSEVLCKLLKSQSHILLQHDSF